MAASYGLSLGHRLVDTALSLLSVEMCRKNGKFCFDLRQ